jgi:hypothetical protein
MWHRHADLLCIHGQSAVGTQGGPCSSQEFLVWLRHCLSLDIYPAEILCARVVPPDGTTVPSPRVWLSAFSRIYTVAAATGRCAFARIVNLRKNITENWFLWGRCVGCLSSGFRTQPTSAARASKYNLLGCDQYSASLPSIPHRSRVGRTSAGIPGMSVPLSMRQEW